MNGQNDFKNDLYKNSFKRKDFSWYSRNLEICFRWRASNVLLCILIWYVKKGENTLINRVCATGFESLTYQWPDNTFEYTQIIQNKMELKFTFLLLFLAVLLIKTNASDDFVVGKCETDFRGKWPQNISDEDLQWVRNSKEDKSGPKFRIFTSQDVRRVQPNLAYHCKLIQF